MRVQAGTWQGRGRGCGCGHGRGQGCGRGCGCRCGVGVDAGVDRGVARECGCGESCGRGWGVDTSVDRGVAGCGRGQGRGHGLACLTGFLRPLLSTRSCPPGQEPQSDTGRGPRVNLGQSPCRATGVALQVPWGPCPRPASCPRRVPPAPTVCSASACWASAPVCLWPRGTSVYSKQRALQVTLLRRPPRLRFKVSQGGLGAPLVKCGTLDLGSGS